MRLISKRLYLDYNATAPLAESVQHWLAKGALPYGNPSSIHSSGKTSKRHINQTTDLIKDTFGVPNFEVFYHSGATEGINGIVKGFCFHQMAERNEFHFVCFASDHSCVVNQKEHVELLGGTFHLLEVDQSGDCNIDQVVDYVKKLSGKVLLNYTLVNNESGVWWPIQDAVRIKEESGCIIHVDAVQMIGKISDYKLSEKLDFFTFSGHKFGALKGCGFTLTNGLFNNWCSLIRGGGQQLAMRSGTENVFGIYSIKLALEESLANYKFEIVKNEREYLEKLLTDKYGARIIISAAKASHRNSNTIYMILEGAKTDILITAFDMAQIDISSGSACSSGAIKPSRVLMAMGFSKLQAQSSIRLSLGQDTQPGDGQAVFNKLAPILDRFLL